MTTKIEPDEVLRQLTTAGPVGLGVAEGVTDGWGMTDGWAMGAAALNVGALINAIAPGVAEGDGVGV
ncbi:MAG TPA: hypothetical protein VF932_09250, partial [Anaerolineae bacterium]